MTGWQVRNEIKAITNNTLRLSSSWSVLILYRIRQARSTLKHCEQENGLHVTASYYVVCPVELFLFAIVLSVLRFTDSDYSFGIFKLFVQGASVKECINNDGKLFALNTFINQKG
jgi:hypothetical protein